MATAHRMLFTNGGIKAGDTVLVLGASGGVGTGTVLLAKLAGAHVIACGSSAEKLERLKAMGADEVIDYTRSDFTKDIYARFGKPHRRTYDGGVDVVVNFTGGDTWIPSLRALKRGGKLLTCGATAGFDPKEDLRFIWTFELKILGSIPGPARISSRCWITSPPAASLRSSTAYCRLRMPARRCASSRSGK